MLVCARQALPRERGQRIAVRRIDAIGRAAAQVGGAGRRSSQHPYAFLHALPAQPARALMLLDAVLVAQVLQRGFLKRGVQRPRRRRVVVAAPRSLVGVNQPLLVVGERLPQPF